MSRRRRAETAEARSAELERERDGLRDLLAMLVSREEEHLWREPNREQGPGHAHADGIHWDPDNREPYAGRVCRWCEAWREARAALATGEPAPAPATEPDKVLPRAEEPDHA